MKNGDANSNRGMKSRAGRSAVLGSRCVMPAFGLREGQWGVGGCRFPCYEPTVELTRGENNPPRKQTAYSVVSYVSYVLPLLPLVFSQWDMA